MADPTLPPGLGAECDAAHRKLIEDLVKHFNKVARLTERGATREALNFLDDLIGGRFREIAKVSYQAGLDKAGEAAQAIDDLAIVRRAFRILGERDG